MAKKDAKGGKGKAKDTSDADDKGKGGKGLKAATSINVRHILVSITFLSKTRNTVVDIIDICCITLFLKYTSNTSISVKNTPKKKKPSRSSAMGPSLTK
jgi:hypothetical protein